MTLEKAKIEELKTKYPQGIFEGEISFTTNEDTVETVETVEFIYRKPVLADMESYSKAAQRNAITANLNLIQSLIVDPEPAPLIAKLRDYPAAYSRFVDDVVSPFFGANVAVKSRKL